MEAMFYSKLWVGVVLLLLAPLLCLSHLTSCLHGLGDLSALCVTDVFEAGLMLHPLWLNTLQNVSHVQNVRPDKRETCMDM